MASTESKKQKKRKHTLSDLKTLGHQLLSSRAHINNLPLLLTFVTPSSPPQYVLESILSLQAFFASVFPELPSDTASYKKSFVHSQAEVDPEFIYKAWLRAKFDEFVKSLIEIAVCPQSKETLREVIMDTIMEFVKLGNRGRFNSALYHRLLCSVVHSVFKENLLLDLLASKYFKYIDVRYFTYVSLEHIIKTLETGETSGKEADGLEGNDENHLKSREEIYVHKIWTTLLHIPPHEKSSGHEMWSESGASQKEEYSEALKADVEQPKEHRSNSNGISAASISKKMKLKFTKAWFAFLRLPLPLDVYKEVLATLHQAVIPYLSNPIMLCDFLIKSYDIGGVISIMALSSLYVLMTQHGLEYPNFYEKLYVLLVPSIFLAKYRAKFFQLLDSCLKSPLIPAYMAAAFAKKLSRLALSVPPSGALVIISLIHNLLRRHPSISCLVHREDSDETAKDDASPKKVGGDETLCTKRGIDQFSNEEIDLVKTKAMLSSLWEIDTLRHHYCPPVSRFVLSLEDDLTVRSKTTEIAVKDFSSGSYSTIFGNEIRRRVKQVPLAFYRATPTSLFSEVDFPGWTFKYEDSNEKNGETKHEDLPFPDEHKSSSAKRQRVECS